MADFRIVLNHLSAGAVLLTGDWDNWAERLNMTRENEVSWNWTKSDANTAKLANNTKLSRISNYCGI